MKNNPDLGLLQPYETEQIRKIADHMWDDYLAEHQVGATEAELKKLSVRYMKYLTKIHEAIADVPTTPRKKRTQP